MRKLTRRRLAALAIAVCAAPIAFAKTPDNGLTHLKEVRRLLELPEAKIDLAEVKVTIDHLIEPSVDRAATLKQLEAMAAAVRLRLPAKANSHQALEALRAYIYQPGPWNDNRPFSYDLDDPYGRDIRNKLLSTYLETRKGNCVSMPLLFLIVGRKLGLDLAVATVPEHVYVTFRDEAGAIANVETTSGGFKLDASYRRDVAMTDEALRNGLYMRALGKRETVALMAGTFMEFLGKQKQHEQRIALAHLILEFYPKDITAMLHKGHAYGQIIVRDFESRYDSPIAIPPAEKAEYARLEQANELWYRKAEALGWRQPSQKQEAKYADSVERAKGASQGERK